MARPPIEIDPEEVEKLAALGCKTVEIAEWFGCSHDTLERRFAFEMVKGRSELKKSLRRWQLESAKKGNVVMQIWLGKQYLGQRDKSDEELKIYADVAAKLAPPTNEQIQKIIELNRDKKAAG